MGYEEAQLVHHNERFSIASEINVSMIFIFATVDTSLKPSCTSRLGSRFNSQTMPAHINVVWLADSPTIWLRPKALILWTADIS